MKLNAIRHAFLDYFVKHGHKQLPSSSLIPHNDPTLLFTNAGMVQFKEVFLGLEARNYQRATTSQRCVRAGGKHNDLENVGYTARHHTFFEMLGNFSFGDYFKQEAIEFAWRFLTEELQLPPEKLWITVYKDDKEAEDIWLNTIKVDPKRFSRCGEDDNFWSMGDTGPCGPCTEIFYDHGPEIAGGPPGSPDQDGDRYVEIWNLVFMQYDRSASGELTPLPKPSVDTGMGIERIAAVMQGVHSNYDIDLFQQLIKAVAKLGGLSDLSHNSLKVIADHIRSCAFLITDGVIPSNEGRGYVLRRIIRRAVRHGNKLGINEPFFHRLVAPLVNEMGQAYPELKDAAGQVEAVLLKEEQQFAKTLEQGLKILEQDIESLTGSEIPGETIFKLYDTYGFPVDLTGDIARERGLSLDMNGFTEHMAAQRRQSRQGSHFAADAAAQLKIDTPTDFVGYDYFDCNASVVELIHDVERTRSLSQGQEGAVVLSVTPFYAESGGQVGDAGFIDGPDGRFVVSDTKKHGATYWHYGHLEHGHLNAGQAVVAKVDVKRRRAIMLNHSATHLLHAALRQELGEHVQQKGSLVEAERLRFDFAHYEAIKPEKLLQIERLVNEKIRENLTSDVVEMTPEEAKQSGALALFGEKYGDKVRVLSMGEFSKELCGGTHVEKSGDIGLFKISSESGIAAGVRRIEAVTGEFALDWLSQIEAELNQLSARLKAKPSQLTERVEQLLERNRELERTIERMQAKLASNLGGELAEKAARIGNTDVLIEQLPDMDMKALRELLDKLKQRLGEAVIVLAAKQGDRLNVVAGMSQSQVGKVPSSADMVKALCGKGGGRPDMAQGGGEFPVDLKQRIDTLKADINTALAE